MRCYIAYADYKITIYRKKWKSVDCYALVYIPFAAIQFQICIQNRYKLNKKYRKLLSAYGDEVDSLESKAVKAQAKVNLIITLKLFNSFILAKVIQCSCVAVFATWLP